MKNYSKLKDIQRKTAKHIIERLFCLLDDAPYPLNNGLRTRYIELARTIAMKFRIKLSKVQKLRYCKYCHRYLDYKNGAKVRLKNKISIKCPDCKKTRIIHLVKGKKV